MDRNKFLNKKNKIFIVVGIIACIIICVYVGSNLERNLNDDLIDFGNSSLEKAVEKYLKDPNISKNDADKVKTLEISDCSQIDNLEGLKDFANLEELYITDSVLNSLDGISNLKKLKVLSCVRCGVTDISELQSLNSSELLYIDLSGSDFSDMDSISLNADHLETLILNDCQLVDEIKLGGMDHLTNLEMKSNLITLINGNFRELEILNLYSNNITDINFIFDFNSLKELNIGGNPIKNIDGISQLKQLTSLGIIGTAVDNINELEKLSQFNSIYLNKEFNRKKIEFMIDNFKNGDRYTKQYILSQKYNLKTN